MEDNRDFLVWYQFRAHCRKLSFVTLCFIASFFRELSLDQGFIFDTNSVPKIDIILSAVLILFKLVEDESGYFGTKKTGIEGHKNEPKPLVFLPFCIFLPFCSYCPLLFVRSSDYDFSYKKFMSRHFHKNKPLCGRIIFSAYIAKSIRLRFNVLVIFR